MSSSETNTVTLASTEIFDRGRGPEIKGTRITVYTILEYLIGGWARERIAELLQLTVEQVQAAMDFIAENDLNVLRDYVKILERIRRGNPPELQTKLDASHQRFLELVAQVREAKSRGDTNIQELIRNYRQARAQENAHAGDHGG